MHIIKNRLARFLVFSLGILSLLLGFIGIFLPLLPTTPFVLLAAWCFLKTSPKTHKWIQNHKWMGPPLKKWEEQRAISPTSKWIAITAITASLAIMWYKNMPFSVQITATTFLVSVSLFIITRPTS